MVFVIYLNCILPGESIISSYFGSNHISVEICTKTFVASSFRTLVSSERISSQAKVSSWLWNNWNCSSWAKSFSFNKFFRSTYWPAVYYCAKFLHHIISLTTIQKRLGWVVSQPKYCQLISKQAKWIDWCRARIAENMFDDIILTDDELKEVKMR